MLKRNSGRAAALAILVIAAAAFLSCGKEVAETPCVSPTERDGSGDIYGYVKNGINNNPIANADVELRCIDPCDDVFCASTQNDNNGYYNITGASWVTAPHEGHTLRVTASKSGYQSAYSDVLDYNPGEDYPVDIFLMPE